MPQATQRKKTTASPKRSQASRPPPSPDSYRRRALDLGAKDAVPLSPADVPTAEWVRIKCQYGCGGYGKRRTCPPHSPTHQQTRRMLDEYKAAVLVRTDGGRSVREIVTTLEREAFLDGYYKAFAFGCGPCHRCQSCDPDGPCHEPEWGRPAMEACGIDVFATARAAGLPLETVRTSEEAQNHYGLLLLE